MTIVRKDEGAGKASFSVGLNIILTGSKKLSPQQQERLLTVGKVRVLIVDASDAENVLVDAEAPAREFSTGSVGYGLGIRKTQFKKYIGLGGVSTVCRAAGARGRGYLREGWPLSHCGKDRSSFCRRVSANQSTLVPNL